jgi:hypothetical protein
MRRQTLILVLFILAATLGCTIVVQRAASGVPPSPVAAPQTAAAYFPERFDWQRKKPEDVGMDSAKLDEAVKLAVASENPETKNLALNLATTFGATEP